MSETKVKSRAFWFVLYPESAVDGWLDILKGCHINFLVSPLHNMDVNADGSKKKPHYHIMLIFPNSTTCTLAEEICRSIGGVRPPNDRGFNGFACSSISSCARYLIHRDDADKYQYNVNDVICYGDITYLECMCSKYEEERVLSDMKLFIEQHRVVSVPLFNAYCRDNMPEWAYVLNTRSSLLIERHIKSMNFVLERLNMKVSYDTIFETNSGEILYHFDY